MSDVLSALLLGGIMGMVGQAARVGVGLKKMNDQAQAQGASWADVFVASRLLISLAIGFVAGIAGAFLLGLDKIIKIDIGTGGTEILMGLAAAGYAGADTIEAFTAKISTSPNSNSSNSTLAASPTELAKQAGSQNQSIEEFNSNITNLSASLNSTKALLADFQTASLVSSTAGQSVASNAELTRDMAEARKYLDAIHEAAEKYDLPPSLICAIGSRESNWGQGSDMHPKGPNGTGDWAPRNPAKWDYAMPPDGLGWGRGLMQVDYAQSDFGKTGKWAVAEDNILFGADELAGNIQFFKANPSPGVDPIRAATAAYNCGRGNVKKAIRNGVDVDSYTTGKNYSRDTLARADWFKTHGFDDLELTA